MPAGGGQYEAECTAAREATGADGVILIVFGGARGNGFSVQATGNVLLRMPAILRDVADQIEASTPGAFKAGKS